MSLRWILSCQWSNVWVPSPVGAFLVVSFRIFVGRGCGPMLLTPNFSAISLISQASLSNCSRLELVSLIRAYCGTILRGRLIHWILTCLPFTAHLKRRAIDLSAKKDDWVL